MKTYETFEDLTIWKDATDLVVAIYTLFKSCKDNSFKDQIQRAAVSIPSNISEGYERMTNKEFIHFLYIAKGSCGELRTQTFLAKKLGYITTDNYVLLHNKAKKLSSQLQSFINTRVNAH